MLDLIFAKYRHSPIILQVLEILSSPIQDTSDAIDYILSHLSIDTAEGEILDFLGELIGVARPPAQEDAVFWLCEPWEVADDPDNEHGLAPPSLDEGGYLTSNEGIASQVDPGTYISDAEYRKIIRAKAATFRNKATRDVVYNYLYQLGTRVKIHEEPRYVEFEHSSYNDLNYWLRNYIKTRGMKPAGIEIQIKEQLASDQEI